MKKFLISGIISIFLLSMSPVAAQDKPVVVQDKLATMPQQELTEDLINITVCMMDNLVASRVVEKIYKGADQEKESTSGAILIALSLGEAIDAQGKIGQAIVEVLIETYKVPKEDIQKFVADAVEPAKADMTVKLSNVTTVDEFMDTFRPTVQHCGEIVNSFAKRLQGLEAEK